MLLGVLGSGRDCLGLFIPSGNLLPPSLGVLGRVSHLAQSPISYFALAHCRCTFCGLPEVSEFKHFNYNFNYVNPFSYFPS